MCIYDDFIINNKNINVLELYSGIGGFSYALKDLKLSVNITAIDISTSANGVYSHNHEHSKLLQRNIESLSHNDIDNWKIDLLTLSPQCQPFTRLGLKKDTDDCRTKSFIHLLEILKKVKNPPIYVMVENVKGFEISHARQLLIETLKYCGFVFQEFLLNPNQFGVPNSRMRYYCIAKRIGNFCFNHNENEIQLKPPLIERNELCTLCSHICTNESQSFITPLNHYLETLSPEDEEMYLLSDKILLKYCTLLDIVTCDSHKSNCFTKGYSHHIEGTGSVIKCNDDISLDDVYADVSKTNDDESKVNLLKQLKLRFFTPREIANLMCFPTHFTFPDHFTDRQKYRLIGNSVNIRVVAFLLKLLLSSKCK